MANVHLAHVPVRKVVYHVFDTPNQPSLDFEARKDWLEKWHEENKQDHITIVQHTLCQGQQHMTTELEKVLALGGEGLSKSMNSTACLPAQNPACPFAWWPACLLAACLPSLPACLPSPMRTIVPAPRSATRAG